jgi:hypothetical protein
MLARRAPLPAAPRFDTRYRPDRPTDKIQFSILIFIKNTAAISNNNYLLQTDCYCHARSRFE